MDIGWNLDWDDVAELNELYWIWVDAGPWDQLYRPFDDQGNFIGDADDNITYIQMVDIFTVFNKSITLDRNNKYWGRYYYCGEGHSKTRFRTEPYPYDITDILSPFIARFGIRFEF